MHDFLIFIGPYKTLAYGFMAGAFVGIVYCMALDFRRERKRALNP